MIVFIHKLHIKEINIKNRVHNYCVCNLSKSTKLATKHILIDEKSYKDLNIYFAGTFTVREDWEDEILGKIFDDLVIDDYMQDKVLDKIKEIIGIAKFYDTKDGKLPCDITLEIVVLLKTCVIKDDDKFYLGKYLEEALVSSNQVVKVVRKW